ncbi:MAG: hypothetical protein IT323_11730 [Anaerolineae bacterium]|nr:hypothetical protein [Anaerolineae bacterium]
MMKRRILLISTLLLVAVGVAACQGGLPPFYVVVVVSPTPDPNVIQVTVTPPEVAAAPSPTTDPNAATGTPSPTPTTGAPLQAVITATPPGPTPTLSAFPTETRAELYIAQQDFERGYMFWISTQKVIWVLLTSPDNPDAGEWRIYQDAYEDGVDPEIDATLTPPGDALYQPRRGFGKLWRETPGLREALGWATTPELALNTVYVYQPGGTLDANGNYVPGPGRHFLTSLGRETFVFIESTTGASTWERVN